MVGWLTQPLPNVRFGERVRCEKVIAAAGHPFGCRKGVLAEKGWSEWRLLVGRRWNRLNFDGTLINLPGACQGFV